MNMSRKKGNLNERDIEDYLSKLEGGWLSEDGLDDQDSDDENRDADEVIRVMQEENDDDDNDVDETADIDPPLVEPEDQESSHPSTSSNLQNAQERGGPKKSLLTMGQFRNELAFVLCTRGTTKEAKRGRPSTSLLEEELQ
ncbi:unnamed protein product [Parnassius apollo]|uniref:(apollo) hypothetical protein n=1 Tax=Parnassius apollo TaxID=110799 RepID=A0A8S3Y6U3_PARAO|nr:unnamed protein product [Parnassius apollo]